jgi:hypothetical protein
MAVASFVCLKLHRGLVRSWRRQGTEALGEGKGGGIEKTNSQRTDSCKIGCAKFLTEFFLRLCSTGITTKQFEPLCAHLLEYWLPERVGCLLYVPPGLTFTNSTFCPHSVFMCFVWISEQTAIISLYNINWLLFITETECVYCAVRAESICTHLKPSGYFMYRQV